MRKAIRIGRLFGIELQLDSSWLFVFALVVWSLTSVFGAWHPAWTTGTAVAAAVVTGLAFFASVVFHELAHALVAKLYELPVRDITLHMFGGVSNIEREPPTPGAELLIAVVGPIASVTLGIGMLVVAAHVTGTSFLPSANMPGAELMADLDPPSTLLVWLGPVNIVVGVFNLIPGFPLDGGRILRALLWKATGNLRVATRWATAVGQAVGIAFIMIGVAMSVGLRVPFFGTGFGSGLWLALIGMFLRGAARQHQAGSDVAEALDGVRVSTLMRTNNATVAANSSVRTLVENWFDRRTDTALPVFFRDRFVGMVRAEDAAKVPAEEWERHTAREIMLPVGALASVAPTDAAFDALRNMEAAETTALPVIVDGELVGMLFERDIARWLALHTPFLRAGDDRPRHA